MKKLISAASFLLLFAIAPTAAAVDPKWGEIEIVRDKWGVPNVFSSTDAGAMYGLGYAQAEDRAFQMYYSLRIIQGRTAEVLGNVTKLNGRETSQDHDKRFRTIGYYRAAKEVARNLDPETRELLEAFSRGVNDSLQENRDRLVYLFDSLGLQPEPWTPADCIASWWHMAQFFAGDGLNDLANLHRFSAPASGPGRGGRGDRGDRGAPAPNAARIVDDAAAVVQEKDVDKEWVREIEEFVKRYGLKPQRTRSAGAPKFSHAWVVGGRKSTTGAPVLVSDPQTPVRNPSLWCEFHIQGKTFNVRGIGVAGSPIILIGFSEHVAWGVTALGADQSDLFVLKTDPAHPDSYFFDGEWRRMQVREETIRVKGGRSEKIIVRETHLGPVVTSIAADVRPGEEVALKRIPIAEKDRDTVQAGFAMARARNIYELLEAVEKWRFPSINLVAGDRDGNIAFSVLGAFPIRSSKSNSDGNLAHRGDSSSYDWQGMVPARLVPRVVNPSEGYLLSGNHRPAASFYKIPLGLSTGAGGRHLALAKTP